MPLFGASAPSMAARFDPSQLTGRDKMLMLGAMMRDVGAGLRGGEGDAIMSTENLLAGRQMMAARNNLMQMMAGVGDPQYQDGPPTPQMSAPSSLKGMIGASAPGSSLGDLNLGATPAPAPSAAANFTYEPPTRTADSASIDDPRVAQLAALGPQFGVDVSPLLEVLKARQPHIALGPDGRAYNDKDPGVAGQVFGNPQNINGWLVNANDPGNRNQYFGKLPDGVVPDGRGGVSNATGLVPALQAQNQATELGKTLGAPLKIQNSDGSESTVLGGQYFGAGGGLTTAAAGADPTGSPGASGAPRVIRGTSQTPGDKKYTEATAEAAAARYKAMQEGGQSAPGAIARLAAMRSLLKDFEGGKYAPGLLDMASAANSVGIPLSPKMTNAQVAQALQGQMVAELMKNPDTGANMFPRVTNFEYENVLKQVPGLAMSAPGRDTLVQIYTRNQQRAQDVSRMGRQWVQRYGRIDAPDPKGRSFDDMLEQWSARYPLYAGIKGLNTK